MELPKLQYVSLIQSSIRFTGTDTMDDAELYLSRGRGGGGGGGGAQGKLLGKGGGDGGGCGNRELWKLQYMSLIQSSIRFTDTMDDDELSL